MKNKIVAAFILLIFIPSVKALCANTFVSFSAGDIMLNAENNVTIFVDNNDCKGVLTAAKILPQTSTRCAARPQTS